MKTPTAAPHGVDSDPAAPRTSSAPAGRGQVTVFLSLFLVVLMGMIALAVDLGMAYLQQRHMESYASSAAAAGVQAMQSYLLQGQGTTDALVTQAITTTFAANNVHIDPSDSCWDKGQSGGAPSTCVLAFRAEYVYLTPGPPGSQLIVTANPPLIVGSCVVITAPLCSSIVQTSPGGVVTDTWTYTDTTGATPVITTVAAVPSGIKVDYAATNGLSFFSRVLGRQNIPVRSNGYEAASGLSGPPIPPTPTPCTICTATPIPTATATGTPTGTPAPTNTPPPTGIPTITPTPANTPTLIPTGIPTNTPPPTPVNTPTMTLTPLPTPIPTITLTPLPTLIPTVTNTPTVTPTPSQTNTPTVTPTATSPVLCTLTMGNYQSGTSLYDSGTTLQVADTALAGYPIIATVFFNTTTKGGSTHITIGLLDNNLLDIGSTQAAVTTGAATSLSTNPYTAPLPNGLGPQFGVHLQYTTSGGKTIIQSLTLQYWTADSSKCTSFVTPTPGPTFTSTAIPTITSTPTKTGTPTNTPIPTNTSTTTLTPTPTSTGTPTFTPVPTNTNTPTPTPTVTNTSTATATATPTSSGTATATPPPTTTGTATPLPTYTPGPYPPPATCSNFVIWGGNTSPPLTLYSHVYLWGDQWDRQVSSDNYDSNARMKGYIEHLPQALATAVPDGVCAHATDQAWLNAHLAGIPGLCPPPSSPPPPAYPDNQNCWTTSPGGSVSGLPSTVGTYVTAWVTTYVARSGSMDYGNIVALVEVQVDDPAQYGSSPGQSAQGLIIRSLWDPTGVIGSP